MNALIEPPIYFRFERTSNRLDPALRCVAGGIAASCLALMIVAASLPPNPAGVGTHTAMGLSQCQFLLRWGIPCPGCGMTTSFSWFARGNIEASLYIQPMGTVLALLAAATFWGAIYVALSGKPAYRLALRIPPRYYLWYLPSFAIMAWAWKIWIHVHRYDGWH